MLEGFPVFDVFGSDNDVQRPALDRSNKISLEIEVDEIAHADRCHQQDFDHGRHLSPHRPSLGIPMPPRLPHQFLRQREQCGDIFRLVERSQSRHIGLGEPMPTRREPPNDGAHPLQVLGADAHIMPGDRF